MWSDVMWLTAFFAVLFILILIAMGNDPWDDLR